MIIKIRIFAFGLICLFFMHDIQAQNFFSARLMAGFSASQIRGDELAGFDKLGLMAGIQMSTPLNEKWDLALEFQFIQKGSQAQITFGTPTDIRRTTLNYVEMPVLAIIKDWYVEEGDYYKVKGHFGLSYGRLVDVSSSNGLFNGDLGSFKKSDFAFLAGVSYGLNAKTDVMARYSNSFFKIYKNDLLQTEGLINYLWSFSITYDL